MNYKQLFENFSVAIISQGVGFLLSAITALVVPKILGVTDYGYWQLFIFYTSYVGFFHFGLNDGVYLLKSGETRTSIDKRDVKSQFLVCMYIQFLVAALIIIASFFLQLESQRHYIICLVALFVILNNTSLFLGFIFQALNETKLYSFSVMIDKLVFLVPLIVMLIMGLNDFRPYILFYVVSKFFSLGYCLYKARDIIRVSPYKIGTAIRNSINSIRVGIILMLSGICSSLILGIARFAIDYKWSIETFGEVSLALSIMTFFLAFITQASMVLFPALKHTDSNETFSLYEPIETLSGLLFPIIYTFYFPVAFLVSLWLPQYSGSMIWLAIFLPACVFDGKMNLCSITYYKVLRKERVMLGVNFSAMLISLCLVFIAAFVFNSLALVLLASLCSILFRAAVSEKYLEHVLEIGKSKRLISEIVLAGIFILIVFLFDTNFVLGEILSIACYIAFILFNHKKAFPYLKKILSVFSKTRNPS